MKKLTTVAWIMALSFASAQAQWPEADVPLPTFKTDTFDIRDFGANATLHTLNTASITTAIDACHGNGGGVVRIPAGVWVSGPFVLKSNVNLYLERNALLQFTDDFDQYPLIETGWEGLKQVRRHSPIRAEGQRNIAITGHGIIDGNGDAWRFVKKGKMTDSQWKKLVASGGVLTPDGKEWYPTENALKGKRYKDAGEITPEKDQRFFEEIKDFLRPNLIVLERCEGILLEGVTFQNSGAWNIHPLMSRDITIKGITVRNPWYSQNGDGLDIESCTNVLVENCSFDVGDDAICVKSGKNEYGRKIGMPTENLWVRNCTVYHAHGGFVVGSEMSGGARNLYISNLTFVGTDIGLRFKTTRGRGGVVENVFIKDIFMKDIPGEAILFDMYYEAVDPVPATGETRQPPKVEMMAVDEGTPQFRNFHISNVFCDGANKGLFIRGLPEMHIRDIHINNLHVRAKQGIDIQEASGISLKHITVDNTEAGPVAYILNSDGVLLDQITYNKGAEVLVHIQGDRSKDIRVENTDAGKAARPVLGDFGAKAQVVSFN
ncbi:glycoside hydrolase family 28 protein [Parapedobacter tibetensis]|uniref:glycoside hydrolase family 28 protein n=1 Tax=Parapedobacter tibetensis TaxID=2972951 RepID=UPI00214D8C43|nr:glycoside hydrolase family 28 protein [Parapedobacter tibetensis]